MNKKNYPYVIKTDNKRTIRPIKRLNRITAELKNKWDNITKDYIIITA